MLKRETIFKAGNNIQSFQFSKNDEQSQFQSNSWSHFLKKYLKNPIIKDNTYINDVNVIVLERSSQSKFSVQKLYVSFCSFLKHGDQKQLTDIYLRTPETTLMKLKWIQAFSD